VSGRSTLPKYLRRTRSDLDPRTCPYPGQDARYITSSPVTARALLKNPIIRMIGPVSPLAPRVQGDQIEDADHCFPRAAPPIAYDTMTLYPFQRIPTPSAGSLRRERVLAAIRPWIAAALCRIACSHDLGHGVPHAPPVS